MYEVGIIEQILILCAKKSKIPIFLLQHGIYHDDSSAVDFNLFLWRTPQTILIIFLYGENTWMIIVKKIDLHSTPCENSR